jgi:putative oxidoreductase
MSSIHNIAFLIGRVIVGGFFLMNGFNHFAQLNVLSGYAKSKGIPAPALAVGGSGVLLFLGGLSLLLGYHPTIGAALLVIFLLGVSFGIHNFWTVQDQQAKLGEMTNFLKNMAILGLLLMTLAIFVEMVMNYPICSELYKYAAYDGLGNLAGHKVREG